MAEGFITRRGGVGAAEVAPLYIQATGGTTTEYNENGKRYKSHTFTTGGTFTVTALGNGERNLVDYLIVAGGGSGGGGALGSSDGGGGGGAGGYLSSINASGGLSSKLNKFEVSETSYTVTVGGGGSSVGSFTQGNNGSNSSVFNLTADGGGGGGAGRDTNLAEANGKNGGSGGGAGAKVNFVSNGGTATSGQGTNGMNGLRPDGGRRNGVGGGGAGFTYQSRRDYFLAMLLEVPGYPGGEGLPNKIRNGTPVYYAGGGGGGFRDGRTANPNFLGGLGGIGGGGDGGNNDVNLTAAERLGQPGQVNTGGGGGGGTGRINHSSGSGGSGIVVIRYEVEAV